MCVREPRLAADSNFSSRDILQTLLNEVSESPAPTARPQQDEMEFALSGGQPTTYHAEAENLLGQMHYDDSGMGYWMVPEEYHHPAPQQQHPQLPVSPPPHNIVKQGAANVWTNTPMGFKCVYFPFSPLLG